MNMVLRVKIPLNAQQLGGVDPVGVADFGSSLNKKKEFRYLTVRRNHQVNKGPRIRRQGVGFFFSPDTAV